MSKAPKPGSPPPPGAGEKLEYPCVENGTWTPIPGGGPPDEDLTLKLKDVNPDESAKVKKNNCLSFHAVGCSGCYGKPQAGARVAVAMAAQASKPNVFGGPADAQKASFFYHLGDIVYKEAPEDKSQAISEEGKDQKVLYTQQFYNQYDGYPADIFAIAGNHDSKPSKSAKRPDNAPILHFLANFCAKKRGKSADNSDGKKRLAMNQPFPYWHLQTPVAHIIGLHTNDVNGGLLDDPMFNDEPQYTWLVAKLKALAANADGRAVILALHYPPYSGAANFSQRGDPNLAPTPIRNPGSGLLQPLAIVVQHAFRQSGLYPDLVISAHAHHYQRITYTYTGGRQTPFLIAGSGGHGPIEKIEKGCDEKLRPKPHAPFDAILPRGVILPPGDNARVAAFNDSEFGFLRITVDLNESVIHGEFFAVAENDTPSAVCRDDFIVDLQTHKLRT
jgi:hypothetical protein